MRRGRYNKGKAALFHRVLHFPGLLPRKLLLVGAPRQAGDGQDEKSDQPGQAGGQLGSCKNNTNLWGQV